MIDVNVWMNDFLQKLNDVFANRVWFVGLQGSYGRGETVGFDGASQGVFEWSKRIVGTR